MRRVIALLIITIFLSIQGLAAQDTPQSDESVADWREDLTFLYAQMQAIHPNLYWRYDESVFQATFDDLYETIPALTDEQIQVELIRFVSLVDGHSYIFAFQDAINFSAYPLRFYRFADEMVVVDAAPDYADVIGSHLVSIGDTNAGELFTALAPLAWNDNPANVDLMVTFYYIIPEVLHALGIVDDVTTPNYVFERPDGSQFTLNPQTQSNAEYIAWNHDHIFGFPEHRDVMYLQQHRSENFWYTLLDDSGTLYVQYNAVLSVDGDGETLRDFSRELETFITNNETIIERVVLDMRNNGGGDNTTYRPLLTLFTQNDIINRPNRFFTLIGRNTYSAAVNFITLLEDQTDTIFIGEPTGNRPNLYGDNRRILLPKSGIEAFVSARYWELVTPEDTRMWIEPSIAVPITPEDYFSDHDPLLEAAIEYVA